MSSFPDRFPHHRLHVYNLALEVAPKLYRLAASLPRGHRSLADQFKRSSTSIAANTTEGANQRTPAVKRQRFADARAKPAESDPSLEPLVAMGLIEQTDALPLAHELIGDLVLIGSVRSNSTVPELMPGPPRTDRVSS